MIFYQINEISVQNSNLYCSMLVLLKDLGQVIVMILPFILSFFRVHLFFKMPDLKYQAGVRQAANREWPRERSGGL